MLVWLRIKRQIVPGKPCYNYREVKHMKRLEKDFIIAWILGMLLPTVILLVAVNLDDRQVSTARIWNLKVIFAV